MKDPIFINNIDERGTIYLLSIRQCFILTNCIYLSLDPSLPREE